MIFMPAAFLKAMQISRIHILLAVLLSVLIIVPVYDLKKGYETAAPDDENSVLIYGRSGDVMSLDPPAQWDGTSSSVINNLYENIVQFAEGSSKLEFVLAETCEISADRLEYSFTLRKNIFFHDKTPFNADAVLFSFERQMKKNHQYRPEKCECFESNFEILLDSIRKKDENTVVFKLKKPFSPFMEMLAMSPMAIVSPAAVKKYGHEFYKNPCGTGPFKFVAWALNDSVIIERNDEYWNGPARLKKVIFKTIPDNKLRLMQLYSGLIDMMDDINPDDLDTIKRNPDITLLSKPGMNIGYIAMNTEKPPFDKVEVRRAVNHAINKKSIINLFYQQTATLAKNPMPPTMMGYNDDIEDYSYDTAKAREYLKLAGLEKGFTATFFVLPRPMNAFPEPEKVANAVIANLYEVGIKVEKLNDYSWVDYQERVQRGEHDMAMFIWSADIPDPDNFLYVLLDKDNAVSGQAQNIAFYKNDILHYTLMNAQSAIDVTEREKLYKKAQEMIHADAPWVPMVHGNLIVAYRSYVKNLKLSPVTYEYYKNIVVER